MGSGEFQMGLTDMALPTLNAPLMSDPENVKILEMWKFDLKEHILIHKCI